MHYDSNYILDKLNSKRKEEDQIESERNLIDLLVCQTDNNGNVIADTHIPAEDLMGAFSDLRLKLAEHMKLDDILFVFGNGTSIYAGSQDTQMFKLEDYKPQYASLDSIIDEVGKLCGIEEQLNALIIVEAYYHLIRDEEKDKLINKLINEIKGVLIGDFVNSVDYHKLYLHEIFC